MARITVEDCLKNVKNHFELVIIGAKRARMLAKNPGLAYVDLGRDKPTVGALREIAENKVNDRILDRNETAETEPTHSMQEKQPSSNE